jgi:hypothetical protein
MNFYQSKIQDEMLKKQLNELEKDQKLFFKETFEYYYELEKRNILPILKELKWINDYIIKGIKKYPINIKYIKYPTDDMFLSCQNELLWIISENKNIIYYSKFIESCLLININYNIKYVNNFKYFIYNYVFWKNVFQNPSFETCQYIIYKTSSINYINYKCCCYKRVIEFYEFLIM